MLACAVDDRFAGIEAASHDLWRSFDAACELIDGDYGQNDAVFA